MGGKIEKTGSHSTEMLWRSVRQHGIDRENVIARIAVTQRARSAGIVADHAADGCARGGRDIDRKPQSVRLEPAIELVEHNAWLDGAAFARNIELHNVIEIFRAVDDEGRGD